MAPRSVKLYAAPMDVVERSDIRRNPESKRERYVTHAEYRATFDVAPQTVQLMMELVYRTLQ